MMKNQHSNAKVKSETPKKGFFLILFLFLGAIVSINLKFIFNNSSGAEQSSLLGELENWNKNRKNFGNSSNRISKGERILIKASNSRDKQFGVQQFAAKNFSSAQKAFSRSLGENPNDPESLIYLNNSVASQTMNSISIGVGVPIGGSLDVAQEILRGVAQAQNEINKNGGIEQAGEQRMVKVVIANDDNDPDFAAEAADNFARNPDIMAVIGHNSSGASFGAAPVYEKAGLVMMSPTSSAKELTAQGSYIFRSTPDTRILAETLAKYSINLENKQKLLICNDSDSKGTESFKEEISLSLLELGGSISNTSCDFSADNFNPDIVTEKAISDGAKAIVLIPSVNRIHQAIEIVKFNNNRLDLLGSHSMYTFDTLETGSAIENLVIPAAWHPATSALQSFNLNSRNLWGSEGTWRTAAAYDGTKAILTGLETSSTREVLRETLANSGFKTKGSLGQISFQSNGNRKIGATLVKVKPGKVSGTGFDFYPVNKSSVAIQKP